MFLESRFEQAIGRIFANGAVPLRLELWNGRRIDLSPAPTVTVTVPKLSALRYFIAPDLNKLGEAFVEGHIRVEGSIHEIFRVAESIARSVVATTRAGFHRVARHTPDRDRKAIEFHYDVSNDFYSLFLDRNMVYSCVDKIASVGMFEHVGLKNLADYFGKIRSLLSDQGLVLNHGITTSDPDSRWAGLGAGEFIDRYVFPDGELPHIALVLKHMSAAGLEVTDVESLRRHYALTCHEWANRLESNRERATAIAGDRRVRIWQIYLAGCAYGFANGWINIYQLLGCKAENKVAQPLPLTREYMYAP